LRRCGRGSGAKVSCPCFGARPGGLPAQSFGCANRCPLSVAEFRGLGWDPPGIRFNLVGREAREPAVRRAPWPKTTASDLADRLISELSAARPTVCLVVLRRCAPAALFGAR